MDEKSLITDILSSDLSDSIKSKVSDIINKNVIKWIPVSSGVLPTDSFKVIVTELYHNQYLDKDFLITVRDCHYYKASECGDSIKEDGFYFYDKGKWNKIEVPKAWMIQIDFEPYEED